MALRQPLERIYDNNLNTRDIPGASNSNTTKPYMIETLSKNHDLYCSERLSPSLLSYDQTLPKYDKHAGLEIQSLKTKVWALTQLKQESDNYILSLRNTIAKQAQRNWQLEDSFESLEKEFQMKCTEIDNLKRLLYEEHTIHECELINQK